MVDWFFAISAFFCGQLVCRGIGKSPHQGAAVAAGAAGSPVVVGGASIFQK